MRQFSTRIAVLTLILAPAALSAQSLGQAAAQESARRAQAGKAIRRYTDADLARMDRAGRVQAPAQGDDAVVSVVLNAVSKGEIQVRVDGEHVFITTNTLRRLGLRLPRDTRGDGDAWVDLGSLGTMVRGALDMERLVLNLDANPELFPSTRIGARSARPEGLSVTSTPSAFVNYAVNWQSGRRSTLSSDLGLSVGTGRLRSELSTREDGGWLRGLTHLQLDDTRRLVRWTFGDTLAASGPLGGDGLLAGVRVTRTYSLDPYFIHTPALDIRGLASTPSTLEVYVNGFLVERRPLAPGQYDLSGVTLPDGRGVVQTVVRDAFGRTQTWETPFYQSSGLLAEGLHEFDYAFGWQRNDFDREFWSYGHPAFYAQHRIGLTSTVTAGARLEARDDMVNAGLSTAVALPIGELQGSWSFSDNGTARGWSTLGSYLFRWNPLSAGTVWRATSRGYGNLRERTGYLDEALAGSSFVGFPAGRFGSLSLRHSLSRSYAGVMRQGGGAIGSLRLGTFGQIFLNADRSPADSGRMQTTVYAGVSLATGTGSNVALTAERSDVAGDTGRFGLDAQRSLQAGPGFGYRVRLSAADGFGASGALQYQTSFGRYELNQETTPAGRRTSFQMSGGLVAMDGALFATRPTSGGFIALRTGVPNVRGFVSNREVGRTDSRGRLFVPNVLPYYGNQIGIAQEDFPLDFEVLETSALVAPPAGGGAAIVFDARRYTSVSGTIVVDGKPPRPAMFGRLSLAGPQGARVEADLGVDGDFTLERLPGGTYAGTVEMSGFVCDVSLVVPAKQSLFTDIGTSTCRAR